jgi:uncharacterized cupin superfamily protein
MTTETTTHTQESEGWRVLVNRHTSERLSIRRVLRSGQACLEMLGSLPPRSEGPPLHVHHMEEEEITVAAGTLSVEVDGRVLQVGAGGKALLAKGSAHRWWNAGDEPLAISGITRPAVDLDMYLEAAFDVLNSGPANRPSLFYMAHLSWRHRQTQTMLLAPLWLQSVLLPIVVGVGTILGRYRGTDWPGCPDRCSKAPLVSETALSPGRPAETVA